MKRFIIILLAFIILGLVSAGADVIYVSGNVSGTWSADTVIVTAEVRVPVDSTLIIEPGVKVLFQANCKFIVDTSATLKAIGSELDSILFDEYILGNHWKGIRFIYASDSCRLEYCHLTNGYAIGNGGDNNGGAVYCYNSNPLIQNCLIINCYAFDYGGGIYCHESDLTIINNTISGNSAGFGGGIYCYQSNPEIVGNTINGNLANIGGGIYCYYSDPTIIDNTISGNSATHGGGIRCSYSSPTIINNTISENSVEYNGGGIYCSYSNPDIKENIISGNSAEHGGGVSCIDSAPCISNNTLSRNSAEYGAGICFTGGSNPTININIINENSAIYGGGIWCDSAPDNFQYNEITNNAAASGGGIFLTSASFRLNKNTIANNSAVSGGGIYCNTSNPVLDNCIVWGNSPQQFYLYSGSSIVVTYSDIQGGWPGTGNINQDPLFVNSAQGDYHLLSNSPCIDSGDPNPIYNDPDFTRADMGCYYFDQGFTNPLTITLAPLNPPVQIPANGGSFDFSIEVTSSSSIPQIFSGFIDITLPSGSIYGPVFGPVSVTLGAGGDIHCFRTQNVPQNAPAGTYSYNAYAVIQGDTVSDSFPFVKLGAGEGKIVDNWDNWGQDFEGLHVTNKTELATLSTFALYPNFPNPFNEKTVISFNLPDAMEVELRIYDIAGREVWRLASRNSQLGTNQMVWNAEGMASGIYFVRLKAGEFSQVQKMVLMK